ncbi:glycosyltransferase [Formosa maritima]|uniref:Glycosyltransferase family 4 protein n=1 Tax=Formosa maritima TaxID=2592046 RepID=A0A5D0GKR9_9FLAO|nr:glycosyltransferase [Formosa maritima]TYA58939.1 glycosyltransferase family 4 protein [Formosa maritima]
MNKKTKISLFVPTISSGGAERVASLFANELTKYFDVTIILLYNIIEFPLNKDIKVITLSEAVEIEKKGKINYLLEYLKFIYKFHKAIKSEKIDVVISFMIRQNIMTGVAKIFNPNLKTIISERCFPSKRYLNNKSTAIATKILIPLFYNKNNKLFSNSIHINKDLIDNFNVKINTNVIYNPILNNSNKPFTKDFTILNDKFQIVTVGRLIPIKNQKIIIEAISTISKNITLDIYGEGELKSEIISYSKNLNLEKNIILNGFNFNVKSQLVNYHCFILSSLSEGFPNALLEAMSVGLPVIATNCMSGPLELLNDNISVSIEKNSFYKAKYGILVNVDDAIGIKNAIQYLQNNNDDRIKYGELGFKRSKDFNLEIISLQLKKLIDDI